MAKTNVRSQNSQKRHANILIFDAAVEERYAWSVLLCVESH